MKFERSAITSGISNIVFAMLTLAALCALQWFVFSRPDLPMMFPIMFWLVGGIVALVFGCLGVSLIRSGGSWLITIDKTGISWTNPDESIDKSFQLDLAELARVETRSRRAGKGRRSRSYFLVTRSGDERKLSPNSGINLDAAMNELERLGVEHSKVHETGNVVIGC